MILSEKFGGDGGMEWHRWESVRERSVWVRVFKWKEKKRKQMRGREMAGQPKEWGSVWDVVGSDCGRWGTQKYLTIFFFLSWDVTFFPSYKNFVLKILCTLILKKVWVSWQHNVLMLPRCLFHQMILPKHLYPKYCSIA